VLAEWIAQAEVHPGQTIRNNLSLPQPKQTAMQKNAGRRETFTTLPLGRFYDFEIADPGSLLKNVTGPRSEATMFRHLRFTVNSGLPERRFV
jgi:hypothetical protein